MTLKIVCFKINKGQRERIDQMVYRDKLYFSRSEFLRSAIRYHLKKIDTGIFEHRNNGFSIFELTQELEAVNNGHETKDSISSKLPIKLQEVMDLAARAYGSRSAFIRVAIDSFLNAHEKFFDELRFYNA